MRTHWGWKALTLLAVAAAGIAPLKADLVTNGGFETGDFTGWTQTGNTGFTAVECPGPGGAIDGNCDAFFGPIGSDGGISQDLSTSVVQPYTIRFVLRTDGGTPSDFSSNFGGLLLSLTNPGASGNEPFFAIRAATSANSTLAFNFRDDPGFMFLDSVSVVPTPEPSSVMLLITVLMGAVFAVRKRIA